MCVGNSHKHKNSKDSEVKLAVCDILDRGEKGEIGPQTSKVKIGNLQVVEEEPNTRGRHILALMGHCG